MEILDSCPEDLKCYDLAHKEQMKEKNYLLYMQGIYNMRATVVAIDNCINGKKSKATYYEEPIRIFQMTEEEKKAEQQRELQKFINFANGMIANSKK